jgi:hypothetical protein
MRDLEPGLGVLWDDGRVSAMIFLVGKWLLMFPGVGPC